MPRWSEALFEVALFEVWSEALFEGWSEALFEVGVGLFTPIRQGVPGLLVPWVPWAPV